MLRVHDLIYSLTQAIARPIQYVDLKNHWFAKAFNTDMTLREDNLAFISYSSIFDLSANVTEHKFNGFTCSFTLLIY